ncbi:MAG: hypothetical protein IJF35_03305 [Clostridia bacterium]|nr:hypothetical protein [Clostridia bacterium]
MRYSAYAECEMMTYGHCEIFCCAESEMKFAPNICEANISQRSYFTWRSQISLAAGEFR